MRDRPYCRAAAVLALVWLGWGMPARGSQFDLEQAVAALLTERGQTAAAQTFTERAAAIRRNVAVAEEEMRRFLERK